MSRISRSRGMVQRYARLLHSHTVRSNISVVQCTEKPRMKFGDVFLRRFETESDFHSTADDALDLLQEGVDDVFDSVPYEYDVTLASGVLTLSLPPHGTWVINKQTPNRQLWVSDFLSYCSHTVVLVVIKC